MNYPARSTTSQRLTIGINRVIQHLKIIILTTTIIEVILNCFNLVTSFDFSWQLAEGQFILSHGHPPLSALQAYGEISPHFSNEYILYEVLIAGIYNILGPIGLIAFFGIISLLIYSPCLLSFYKSRSRLFLGILVIFLAAQFVINFRIAARPELIAYPCFVLLGTILVRHRTLSWSGRETAEVGLLFFIWSNAHGSFLIGLGMLGLWFSQIALSNWKSLIQEKQYTFFRPILAAFLGSALNPYGLFRFVQPFQLHGLLWGQATSLEMWPVTPGMQWLPLTCTITAIAVLLLSRNKTKCYWLIITVLILHYQTVYSNRYASFLALTLLVAIYDFTMNGSEHSLPASSLSLSLGRLATHIFFVGSILFLLGYIVFAKQQAIASQLKYMDAKTLFPTNSSFLRLTQPPPGDYFLLSSIREGSWSQLPGIQRIHPLLDSGTHRYSDRTNQLYYYCLFRPETFRLALSTLNVNAIIVESSNSYWASLLNRDDDWKLTSIDSTSQLYLKRSLPDTPSRDALFSEWEANSMHGSSRFASISVEEILRGIGLRPDKESLEMLVATRDASWMFDPQITYLRDWLDQVPDNLIVNALNEADRKSKAYAPGLRILFHLRLKQYQQAADIARNWNPSFFDSGSQDMKELKSEAFIYAGDKQAAQRIIEGLWPQPRYSLRWAILSQTIYSGEPLNMPANARRLSEMAQNSAWQEEIIKYLNQNISRLSIEVP